MKAKQIFLFYSSIILLLFVACAKDSKPDKPITKSYLDTLSITHSMKGWELYSWTEGNDWYFSVMVGTNRAKTYEEVISHEPADMHLITVNGIDSLKLVLAKFPEDEYITWIGKGWLQTCWGGNYGNLQRPPQNYIDDITQFCILEKLNLQVTD